MARRRMIDPSFWTSYHTSRLTHTQRLLFLGLVSCADDEGRSKGLALYLRSVIFPYDDLPRESVEADLSRLADEGLIVMYESGGEPYLCISAWTKYQTISHPAPSNLPAPPLEAVPLRNDSGEPPEPLRNDSGKAPEPFRNDSITSKSSLKEENLNESSCSSSKSEEDDLNDALYDDDYFLKFSNYENEPEVKTKIRALFARFCGKPRPHEAEVTRVWNILRKDGQAPARDRYRIALRAFCLYPQLGREKQNTQYLAKKIEGMINDREGELRKAAQSLENERERQSAREFWEDVYRQPRRNAKTLIS